MDKLLQIGANLWDLIFAYPIWALLAVVGLFLLPKVLFKALLYWYAVTHKHDLVYMQVTLPRKDSKLDQE